MPDIVIYNGTCYSIWSEQDLMAELEKNQNVRLFIIGHLNSDFFRDISELQAELVRKAYKRAEKVFFVSQRSVATAERHLCQSISNAEIVRNPVNLLNTAPLPYPSFDGPAQLATVGNLITSHKGQDLLLAALATWHEQNWHLNIYGEGPDRTYLEKLMRFYSIEQKVSFHGKVDDIRPVWEKNHGLIMPSHMEGMPLAVVEAMLCGRICIASDVGGITEWIRDNENGFLIKSINVQGIRDALTRAWAKKSEWSSMGALARKDAEERFDPDSGRTLLNRIIAS